MKILKQITKITCTAFSLLFAFQTVSAQVYKTLDLSSGSGTLVLCTNTTYIITLTPPSGYTIYGQSSYYTWSNGIPNCISYGTNQVELCLANAAANNTATIKSYNGGTEQNLTANFIVLNTFISGTVSPVCEGASPEFIANCNTQGTISYSWSVPSFLTITSGAGTGTIYTNANNKGFGNVQLTVTTSDGCSTGNLAIEPFAADNGSPAAPAGSLTYSKAPSGVCEFNANISNDVYAKWYEWSLTSNFSSILETTAAPATTGDEFDPNTNYTVYVKVQNACGSSWSNGNSWNKTTPPPPPGCRATPIRPNKNLKGASINYNVYPIPASNELTIDNQSDTATSNTIFSLYDLLGHKVIGWSLSSSNGIYTENISQLSEGLYIYIITSDENIIQRGKIIIQH